ncbi:MAG: indolepyruvate oxidoreductase subunit beta [Caldiserica bacterium]|jgi:indolepyruvate ferredoxin oxidoreductase beta subunit|nr:indolepyruvate oxidoreductase subunit beta [Caldisericota bacterium]
MELNLIVAGVGGQGSVLASHIIAESAISQGLKARVGETFGAAMRGGAVASHVRIGDVSAPLVQKGKADAILALEPLEGLRVGVDYLSPTGIVILNTRPIPPVDVSVGIFSYPDIEEIISILSAIGKRVYHFDATELAIAAGNYRTLNSVILGAFSTSEAFPFQPEVLLESISSRVPPSSKDANEKAFNLGREKMEELREKNK